jgi:tyrosine-protein kinase Etk/Wzc
MADENRVSLSQLDESDQPVWDALVTIAKHKRIILGITVLVTVLSMAVVVMIPNRYTADALLLPPSQSMSAGTSMLGQLGGVSAASIFGMGIGLKNPGDMYVSLFRSRPVEDAVIRRFGLLDRYKSKNMKEARDRFERLGAVELGAKDGLIRLSMTDSDPRFAAELVNGYIDEFRKFSANLALTEAAQRRLFFERQLKEAKGNLANSEVALKNTEQTTGVLQIEGQARALIESTAALRAQVIAKQVQIEGMRTFATDQNPELFETQKQLDELQSKLKALNGVGDGTGDDLIIPKGKLSSAAMEYIRKYRDVRYSETVYELLARQYEMAKLDEARQGTEIQIAAPALPPDKKSAPHRTLTVLTMFTISFFFSILGVILRERLRDSDAASQLNRVVKALTS